MELVDALHILNQKSMLASQLCDVVIGTVLSITPLKISIDLAMAPLTTEVLYLTENVVKKQFTALTHSHNTIHTHTVTEGSISSAGNCSSELSGIKCYINGKAVPNETGYVTLNPGLIAGDKVILLRVQNGQKFIVLSKLYESEG